MSGRTVLILLLGSDSIGTQDWRLPDLEGVMLLRLILGLKIDQLTIVEDRVTITDHWSFYGLLDQVVVEQYIVSAGPVVERIERVFTIG